MFRSFKRVLLVVLALMVIGSGIIEAAVDHVVEPGETVWLISQKYCTTVSAVAGANSLANADLIYCGQKLLIPERHRVASGESVWLISQKYGTTVAAIAGASKLVNPELIYPGQILIVAGEQSGGDGAATQPSRGGRVGQLSQADLDLFARLVHAESAGEPYAGQVAVAATVLNRVSDSRYPDTVRGVIMQVWGGYFQYSPVEDGRINLPAGAAAYRAVEEALGGADPSHGATGFYNPAKTTNQWVRSQPVTTTIGNHVFFR
jgi:N-acetylmuramoyl-L-alanine amidase